MARRPEKEFIHDRKVSSVHDHVINKVSRHFNKYFGTLLHIVLIHFSHFAQRIFIKPA